MNVEDKKLEELFYSGVLPRYEEIKDERYVLNYSKTIKKRSLAEIQLIPGQYNTPEYYLLFLNKETISWTDDAKMALMAHELGHVLAWKGYLPTRGNVEESISLQAVSRGFGKGFRHIFSQYCQKPCWNIERRSNGVVRVFGETRESGGLQCSLRVLGSQYCPFSGEKPEISLLTHIKNSQIACALCSTQIQKIGLKCENCQSQYHSKCIDPWLSQESSCPICKVILIDDES